MQKNFWVSRDWQKKKLPWYQTNIKRNSFWKEKKEKAAGNRNTWMGASALHSTRVLWSSRCGGSLPVGTSDSSFIHSTPLSIFFFAFSSSSSELNSRPAERLCVRAREIEREARRVLRRYTKSLIPIL